MEEINVNTWEEFEEGLKHVRFAYMQKQTTRVILTIPWPGKLLLVTQYDSCPNPRTDAFQKLLSNHLKNSPAD